MKTATPTVTLFLRIPPALRDRLAAKLKERHADGAYRATLQSVSIEAIDRGLASVGENPAQLSHPAVAKAAAGRPSVYVLPTPAPSKATAQLAKLTAAKVSGRRKAASKPAGQAKAKASKRGGK